MSMQAGTERLRLFAAVEIDEEWRSSLATAVDRLRGYAGNSYKWVRPDLMHITVVFMGNQDPTSLDAVSEALKGGAAQTPAFDMKLSKLGTFGPPQSVSVVWAGVEQSSHGLERLHAAVTGALEDAGVEFDRKPLVPHVTLARGRRPVNREASLRLTAAIARTSLPPLRTPVVRLVLLRSKLSPAGPTYEPVEAFPLGNS